MASTENTNVELIQGQIEYVLVEQQDVGKSASSTSKDVQLVSGLQVISPCNVTSQASLTETYQFPLLSEQISGHEVAAHMQADNMLSQEQDALLKHSNIVTASLCSSAAQQDSNMVTAFTTMSEIGDVQSEIQALHSDSMGYIVEVSREAPVTSSQLDSGSVVQIVNESLSSEMLNSLPPGSHIIFNSTGKKCPGLLAALATKQNDFKVTGNDSDNNMCDSGLSKEVLLNKADVMLNGEMETFPSAEKGMSEMTLSHETDNQVSQTDSVQTEMEDQESVPMDHTTQNISVAQSDEPKKDSEDEYLKLITDISWPQNNTCKVSTGYVRS